MDCQDEPEKYTGKTVRFLAQVCQTNRAGKNSFVPGRFAMTCCVQDIQFVGFPCSYDGYKALEQRAWGAGDRQGGLQVPQHLPGQGPGADRRVGRACRKAPGRGRNVLLTFLYYKEVLV